MNSPVAIATASLVAATIPPLVERRSTRIRSSAVASRSRASTTSGRVERSSTTHHSQSG